MNFLKDHFEKLILGLVLLVSVGGIFFVITQINQGKQQSEAALQSPRMMVREYEPADLSAHNEELNKVSQPITVGITGDHELLNPVRWKEVNGNMTKVTELGVKKLTIDQIKPLYRRLQYLRSTEYGKTTRFVIEITEEGADTVGKRKPTKRTFEIGKTTKSVPYTLIRVDGTANAPSRFYVQYDDEDSGTTENIQFTPEEPYENVVGYSASFLYQPTGKKYENQRVNDTIKIEKSSFDIVAITQSQATLENKSGKRTTLDFNNNR